MDSLPHGRRAANARRQTESRGTAPRARPTASPISPACGRTTATRRAAKAWARHREPCSSTWHTARSRPPYQPWAGALYDRRKDEQQGQSRRAVPAARAVADAGASAPKKILQMPGLLVLLHERNMEFRQIFIDGRPLPRTRIRAGTATPRPAGTATRSWWRPPGCATACGPTSTAARSPTGEDSRTVPPPELRHARGAGDDRRPQGLTRPFTVAVNQHLALDTDLLEYACLENEKDVPRLVGSSQPRTSWGLETRPPDLSKLWALDPARPDNRTPFGPRPPPPGRRRRRELPSYKTRLTDRPKATAAAPTRPPSNPPPPPSPSSQVGPPRHLGSDRGRRAAGTWPVAARRGDRCRDAGPLRGGSRPPAARRPRAHHRAHRDGAALTKKWSRCFTSRACRR